MACPNTYKEPYCKKKVTKREIPKKYDYSNCKVWFDGCNYCSVSPDSKSIHCEQIRACRFASPPPNQYCKENAVVEMVSEGTQTETFDTKQ